MAFYTWSAVRSARLGGCGTLMPWGVLAPYNCMRSVHATVKQFLLCVQAIRAPLIVAVLESYYSIHNEAWTGELQAIFPHLAKLVCSAQPTVRKALGQLMRANLPYALADVPS